MGAPTFYVYILASRIGGTLYIGVTNDLVRRVYEQRFNRPRNSPMLFAATDGFILVLVREQEVPDLPAFRYWPARM
jgi:hypothetical protein